MKPLIKIAGAFSLEADLLVDAALRGIEEIKTRQVAPIVPFIRPNGKRPFTVADCAALRIMAANCGWIEQGGKGMGGSDRASYYVAGKLIRPAGKTQQELNDEGNGRTQWVGQPEWAQGFDMNPEEIRAAVEKAIAGQRLGPRQRLLIQGMYEEILAMRQ